MITEKGQQIAVQIVHALLYERQKGCLKIIPVLRVHFGKIQLPHDTLRVGAVAGQPLFHLLQQPAPARSDLQREPVAVAGIAPHIVNFDFDRMGSGLCLVAAGIHLAYILVGFR